MSETGRVLLVGNFLSGLVGTRAVSEELEVRLLAAGWQVVSTSRRRGRIARLVDMLGTTWRRRSAYDVAHIDVFSGQAFLWAEAVAGMLRRLGKPYVLTLRGGNLPPFARRWPGRVRRLLHSTPVVTTPSFYLLEQMRPCCPHVQRLPNPLDLRAYPFRQRSTVSPRLAWLRAFHAIYNPTMAAETVALLKDDFPDITLTMFGPDKGDGALQAMQAAAERLGVADRIQTPGLIPKAQVPAALAPLDIFLNTTTAESFGVSVMEAAALGLCIVTTDVGELPYLWQDGVDALLVPSGNSKAMAAAVRRILMEPTLAAKLSANGRAKAEAYDWAAIFPRWETIFHDLAAYPQGSAARSEAPAQ